MKTMEDKSTNAPAILDPDPRIDLLLSILSFKSDRITELTESNKELRELVSAPTPELGKYINAVAHAHARERSVSAAYEALQKEAESLKQEVDSLKKKVSQPGTAGAEERYKFEQKLRYKVEAQLSIEHARVKELSKSAVEDSMKLETLTKELLAAHSHKNQLAKEVRELRSWFQMTGRASKGNDTPSQTYPGYRSAANVELASIPQGLAPPAAPNRVPRQTSPAAVRTREHSSNMAPPMYTPKPTPSASTQRYTMPVAPTVTTMPCYSRVVIIRQIPKNAKLADLTRGIRGGALEGISLSPPSSSSDLLAAIVVFCSSVGAGAFGKYCNKSGGTIILGKKCPAKLECTCEGKGGCPAPPSLDYKGKTRVIRIESFPDNISREALRNDLRTNALGMVIRSASVDKILLPGDNAVISFSSIHHAGDTITHLKRYAKPIYKTFRITYYQDECSRPMEELSTAAKEFSGIGGG